MCTALLLHPVSHVQWLVVITLLPLQNKAILNNEHRSYADAQYFASVLSDNEMLIPLKIYHVDIAKCQAPPWRHEQHISSHIRVMNFCLLQQTSHVFPHPRCPVFSTSGWKVRSCSSTRCAASLTQPCPWPPSSAPSTACQCSSGGRRPKTMVSSRVKTFQVLVAQRCFSLCVRTDFCHPARNQAPGGGQVSWGGHVPDHRGHGDQRKQHPGDGRSSQPAGPEGSEPKNCDALGPK